MAKDLSKCDPVKDSEKLRRCYSLYSLKLCPCMHKCFCNIFFNVMYIVKC